MIIARVVGTVVATRKDERLVSTKLLVARPVDPSGKADGNYEVFADGFKGSAPLLDPSKALARPDGVAQGPDGSVYIGDSQKGKIWRVMYKK